MTDDDSNTYPLSDFSTGQAHVVLRANSIKMEGNAREAIQFYEKAIGAKVLAMSTYGDMPEMPNTFTDELKNLVAHARLQVGESELMFSNAPGGSATAIGKQLTICITTNSVENLNKFMRPYGKTVKSICLLKKPPSAQVLLM